MSAFTLAEVYAAFEDTLPEHADIDVVVVEDGGDYVGRYALDDESCFADNPLDDDELVTFTLFGNGRERDEWLLANVDGVEDARTPLEISELLGVRRFLVERYEHSLVRYSTVDLSAPYPDRRWDVASGVAVIELSDEFSVETREEYRELADSLLDRYTAWCNGWTYGMVEVHFSAVDDGAGEPVVIVTAEETMYGFLGEDEVIEALRTGC